MNNWSKKYWWWIAAHQQKQTTYKSITASDSAYFYCPYVPMPMEKVNGQ